MLPNIWTAYPDKDPADETCSFYVGGTANDHVRVMVTTIKGYVAYAPAVFIGRLMGNLDIQEVIY